MGRAALAWRILMPMDPRSVVARAKAMIQRVVSIDVRWRIRRAIHGRLTIGRIWLRLDPALRVARVGKQTQLVIDGFMRSGNSYARSAFMYSNGAEVPISTHMHSPLTVRLGVRAKLPVIVLIRDPGDAVASCLQFLPDLKPRAALCAYIHYYHAIIPLHDRVVVSDFVETTTDFGGVIRRCNDKFGTDFVPYDHTPAAEQAVRDYIDASSAAFDSFETKVPRPSERRLKADVVIASFDESDVALLGHARELYARLREFALP